MGQLSINSHHILYWIEFLFTWITSQLTERLFEVSEEEFDDMDEIVGFDDESPNELIYQFGCK